MWFQTRLLCQRRLTSFASSTSAAAATRVAALPPRPYPTLLQAMQLGSRGLLVASDVFEQFQLFFKQSRQAAAAAAAAHEKNGDSDDTPTITAPHLGAETIACIREPLASFCGSPADVEPFTILLMKVLCDLRRLEDMRFLFALCLNELGGGSAALLDSSAVNSSNTTTSSNDDNNNDNNSSSSRSTSTTSTVASPSLPIPSVELFNVYLSAISSTDTFNANEIENVERFMEAKGVQGDVVTRLSLFLLYMRLGEQAPRHGAQPGSAAPTPTSFSSAFADPSAAWPSIRDEVQRIIQERRVEDFPLLELRLLHCFQVLVRLHHNVQTIHECFLLVRAACPTRLRSDQHLIPYMVLSVANYATPPHMVIDIIRLLEERRATERLAASSSVEKEEEKKDHIAGPDLEAKIRSTTSSSASTSPKLPPLHSEITVFRLLAKCAMHGDHESLQYVLDYLERYGREGFVMVSAENQPMLTLLQMQALARAGRGAEALIAAETAALQHMDAAALWFVPGEPRTRIRVQNRRVLLATPEPIADVVEALAKNDVQGLQMIMDTLGLTATTTTSTTASPSAASLLKDEKQQKGVDLTTSATDDPAHRVRPTGVSLQLLLAAAARLGASDLSAMLLCLYVDPRLCSVRLADPLVHTQSNTTSSVREASMPPSASSVHPTPFAVASYVSAALPHRPALAADRVREVLRWCGSEEPIHVHLCALRRQRRAAAASMTMTMANRLSNEDEEAAGLLEHPLLLRRAGDPLRPEKGPVSSASAANEKERLRLDRYLLRACMEAALAAGDARLALQLGQRAADQSLSIDIRHGARLVQLTSALGDALLVRRARDVLQATHTPMDVTSTSIFKMMNL